MAKRVFEVWEQSDVGSFLSSRHSSWQLASKEANRKTRLPFNTYCYGIRDLSGSPKFFALRGGIFVRPEGDYHV